MKFYKVRNAEGLYLRGPRRYSWEGNWVKVGKTWQRFSDALAAGRNFSYNRPEEQLDGVVIVEFNGAQQRALPLKDALAGYRLAPQAEEHTVTFVFPTKELLDSFIGYMSDGGGEYGFLEMESGLDFDYHAEPGRVLVTEVDDDET